MSEQTQTQASTQAKAPEAKAAPRAISDPREVAAVVMARMHQVKAKRDELSVAIDGLIDITQQLTRTYGAQLVALEQLRRRVKALEAQVAQSAPAPETVQ